MKTILIMMTVLASVHVNGKTYEMKDSFFIDNCKDVKTLLGTSKNIKVVKSGFHNLLKYAVLGKTRLLCIDRTGYNLPIEFLAVPNKVGSFTLLQYAEDTYRGQTYNGVIAYENY